MAAYVPPVIIPKFEVQFVVDLGLGLDGRIESCPTEPNALCSPDF